MTVRQFLFRDRNEARETAMWTHGKDIAGREPQVQRPCGGSLLGTVKDKLAGVWLEPGEWDRVAAEDGSLSPRSQLGPVSMVPMRCIKCIQWVPIYAVCSPGLLSMRLQPITANLGQTLSLLDSQTGVYVLSLAQGYEHAVPFIHSPDLR